MEHDPKCNCFCHNPLSSIAPPCPGCKTTTQTTPSEGWEKEFDERYPAFKGVGAPFPIFSENPNREHIKQFLRETRTAAYEKGVRDSLEALPKEQAESGTTDQFFGFNVCLSQVRTAISTLLT